MSKKRKQLYNTRKDLNNEIPLDCAFPPAERSKTDKATNAAMPSDRTVEELREWSEQNRQ